jgi:fucose 4-O-acetylase-like acetyltransferase
MARDPWLDNVKLVLVTMVVVGHALVMVPDDGPNGQVYDFIYAWHIPAFVLVTGFLSRGFAWNRRSLWSLVCTIAVPYVLFEFLMMWYRTHRGGEQVDAPLWLNPHWPMWYLAAVFLWRLATPLLKRHWASIPATVALSLVFPTIGAHWTWYLDLNRAVGFLPFFTIGLFLSPAVLRELRSRAAAVAGAATLLGLWWLVGHADAWISSRWLYYSFPYDSVDATPEQGTYTRLAMIVVSAVAALAVLAVVPRRRTWFTGMGAATMVVYLVHGFAIRELGYLGYAAWARSVGWWSILPTVALATLIAVLLAWQPVARRLTWLVDPVGSVTRLRRARADRLAAAVPTQPAREQVPA